MERYGMVIKVRPEKLDEYKRLHANPWPGVLKTITECNIRNFSIYYKDGFLCCFFSSSSRAASNFRSMASDAASWA